MIHTYIATYLTPQRFRNEFMIFLRSIEFFSNNCCYDKIKFSPFITHFLDFVKSINHGIFVIYKYLICTLIF